MTTVLLCSRNGAKYIKKQIDSILAQPPELMLHIFDDCSDDGTAEIIKGCMSEHPDRIVLTQRECPTGSAAANFLSAIRAAEASDYYMLSDQDDVWHRDKYTKLLSAMKIHESIHGNNMPILLHSDARVTDSELNEICPSFFRYAGLSPQIKDFNHLLLQNQVTGGSCIFNGAFKKLIDDAPLPEKSAVHDHWMAITASAFGKIYHLDEALYDYRQHDANGIGAKKASFVGETARRLGLGKESRDEINEITKKEFSRVYSQAEEFLKIYGDRLDSKKLEALKAFVSIPKSGKLKRMLIITKYGFHFNNFYRLAGEYIFI